MTPSAPLVANRRSRRSRPAHRNAARLRGHATAVAVLAVSTATVLACPSSADASGVLLVLSSPVTPVTVQRLASLPEQPWLVGHRGVDLRAQVGTDVKAPGSGVVSYVGYVVDRPVLSIRHDHGLVTSLEPVDSTLAVGDTVTRGQTVGAVADSQRHCGPSPCVHWGLRLNGAYVDPLDYLEGFGPIGLLPMGGY